jgi:hypothetical protein
MTKNKGMAVRDAFGGYMNILADPAVHESKGR